MTEQEIEAKAEKLADYINKIRGVRAADRGRNRGHGVAPDHTTERQSWEEQAADRMAEIINRERGK
jgi:hypothetical protein